jgi:5-methylcytosine-specific restriction endonuclease McrA
MALVAKRRVLVLNKSWSPVGVISLQRAIGLLWATYVNDQPKALVVDPDSFATFTWNDWSKLRPKEEEEVIKGARELFKVPEVIVLSKYDKLPTHKVTFSRRTIYKRDNYECQYCGATPGATDLTIDHVLPRSKGGKTTWENCVLSCLKCNAKKANLTLEDAYRKFGMKLLRKPSKPKYQLFRNDGVMCRSWKKFISMMYWDTELENNN